MPSGCRILVLFIAATALSSCEGRVDARGFVPNPDTLAEIRPGVQDKLDVANLLGTPSAVASFDDDTWYYISQQTRNFAFFKPEIVEQRVLAIRFGDDDKIESTEAYTLADGAVVAPVERTTPTAGHELSLLQQLFGNIGRFSR